jgi:NADH:ubiquinone oxidoreductase subunit 3 (subunit A)
LTTTIGETIATYSAYIILVIVLLILPLLLLVFIFKDSSVLHSEAFEKRWGELFEGINKKEKLKAAFNLVYMIRRVLFLSIAFYGDEIPVF